MIEVGKWYRHSNELIDEEFIQIIGINKTGDITFNDIGEYAGDCIEWLEKWEPRIGEVCLSKEYGPLKVTDFGNDIVRGLNTNNYEKIDDLENCMPLH
jgi:hypothetical protein